MFGAQASARPEFQSERVLAMCALFRPVDWASDDAVAAAHIRASLKRKGETIGLADSFIAGQAVNRGWALATSNTREFARIEGLALEDWSA
jgi:tRNA(fMet)-specific endonuclease VapC